MIGAFETRESIFWQHQMALLLPLSFQSGVSTSSSSEEEDWLLTAGRDWTRSEKNCRRNLSQSDIYSWMFCIDGSRDVICLKASSQLFVERLKAPAMPMPQSQDGVHLKWISYRGKKKCSFNQCVSVCVCVCVCTVKEGTSQRDRFRQSYCILFALFRISQLYLTCFFFPFTDVNVPRPV